MIISIPLACAIAVRKLLNFVDQFVDGFLDGAIESFGELDLETGTRSLRGSENQPTPGFTT
ncbi:hypothetical protein ACQGAO_32180 [Rhodococcus sp. 1.20]